VTRGDGGRRPAHAPSRGWMALPSRPPPGSRPGGCPAASPRPGRGTRDAQGHRPFEAADVERSRGARPPSLPRRRDVAAPRLTDVALAVLL
jgi:hypothetical protein